MIDDVRLWEYTRTEEEIQSSMETGLLGTEPGLKAYWNFNEGDGPFVNDMTTNNTNGMLGSDGWPDIHDPEWVAIPEPTIILLGSLIMLAKLLIAYRK